MDTLTMIDRGDCCAAQARVLVGKGSLRLMFCLHHFNKHQEALLADDWEIIIKDMLGLEDKVGARVG